MNVTRRDLETMCARLARNLSTRTGEDVRVVIEHPCPGVWRIGAVVTDAKTWREAREIIVATTKGEAFSHVDAACKALEYVSERQRGAAHLARA